MKTVLLLFGFAFCAFTLSGQTVDPWIEYMTPSDTHEMLGKYVGNFRVDINMFMGEDTILITVQSENKMILGRRFLEISQHGEMMAMNYESITTIGFHNSDEQFALTTVTNMGTGTLSLFGKWNESSQSATLSGQLTNPVTKEPINVRQVLSFIDSDNLLIESFDQEAEEPFIKTVQYKFSRM